MNSRYLNSDPMPWLTDGKDPAVTYLAQVELSGIKETDRLYRDLESSVLTHFFRAKRTDGIPGDKKNIDLVNRGTVWFFLLASEYGYNSSTPFISQTAEFIINKIMTPDGGFSLSIKPQIAVACRTGDVLRALLKSGIRNEHTDAALSWIISKQRRDGSWLHCPFNGIRDLVKVFLFKKNGTGLIREHNDNIPGCPVATLSCIRALAAADDPSYKQSIEEGCRFLLNNSCFMHGSTTLPCGLTITPLKNGYPVMSQYDILSVMNELSHTSLWDHPLCGTLFNRIIKKQSPEGTWELENTSRGMVPGRRTKDRFVTLNVLRLLKSISEKENQLEKA